MADPRRSAEDAVSDMLAGYAPSPGVPDELIDTSGWIRPVWQPFLNHIA